VGAPLARVELTEVFHALTGRFETFGLAVDVTELRPRTEQLVGGMAELPACWTAQ
jgi:cytochrome P450